MGLVVSFRKKTETNAKTEIETEQMKRHGIRYFTVNDWLNAPPMSHFENNRPCSKCRLWINKDLMTNNGAEIYCCIKCSKST